MGRIDAVQEARCDVHDRPARFRPLRFVQNLDPADRHALALIESGSTLPPCEALPELDASAAGGDGTRQIQLFGRLQSGERLLRQLKLLPEGSAVVEGALPDGAAARRRAGLVLLRGGSGRRAVLVFNGNTEAFSVPTPLLAESDTHVILMRDPSRCFGLLGIPELGRNYTACMRNLRRILAALKADEVYCIGMSSGGASALKFGCDLNVRGILGFSIPTTLDLRDDHGAGLNHHPQLTRLYWRARHLGIDLAAYYAARSPRPGVMLVYSKGHKRDAWLAGRMQDIPGVDLIDADGFHGHGTYRWFLNHGTLNPLVDRLFALAPFTA